jgi:COX assembly protein 1
MVREKLMCGHILALRSKMKAQALKECDEMVAKFAECAEGRTLSVIWSC